MTRCACWTPRFRANDAAGTFFASPTVCCWRDAGLAPRRLSGADASGRSRPAPPPLRVGRHPSRSPTIDEALLPALLLPLSPARRGDAGPRVNPGREVYAVAPRPFLRQQHATPMQRRPHYCLRAPGAHNCSCPATPAGVAALRGFPPSPTAWHRLACSFRCRRRRVAFGGGGRCGAGHLCPMRRSSAPPFGGRVVLRLYGYLYATPRWGGPRDDDGR